MYKYDTLFPDELDALIEGPGKHGFGAVAILPVGSVEQHGPHLLLGCDGYISLALAHMVAEKVDGVLCPMLPFSWIGGLRPFAGTIDMRPFITGDYMEQVALELFRQGFSRLAIVNSHGGGLEMVFSVGRRVYKRTRKPVVTVYPSFVYKNWPELYALWTAGGNAFSWSAVEASELAGALEYLGNEALSGTVLKNNMAALAEYGDFVYTPEMKPQGFHRVHQAGEVGFDFNHECQHVQPSRCVDPAIGRRALEFMAEKIAFGVINAE